MKFAKLTLAGSLVYTDKPHGDDITVTVDMTRVVWFAPAEECNKCNVTFNYKKGTHMNMGSCYLTVKESPEYVMAILESL